MPMVMKKKLHKILNGHGVRQDIEDLLNWGKVLKASRCGLGQTAGNPILSSLVNFRHLYEEHVKSLADFDTCFDMEKAIKESSNFVGRKPVLHHI
jgi:hypothetical protein